MIPMSNDRPPFIGNATRCANEGYDVPSSLLPSTIDAAVQALPPSLTEAAVDYLTSTPAIPFARDGDGVRHSAAGGGCRFCWCLEARQLKVFHLFTLFPMNYINM